MITITEIDNGKLPSYHSLMVEWKFYDAIFFKQIMELDSAQYDKKTGNVEILPMLLSKLVNLCLKYDDVEFKPILDSKTRVAKKIPKTFKFKVKPFEHQVEGIEYIMNKPHSINLFDMGLGKTSTVINAMEVINPGKVLIICGVSSLKSNWANEIKTFSNSDYIILDEVVDAKGKLKKIPTKMALERLRNPIKEKYVIINKEKLVDKDFAESFKKSKNKFAAIVVDEIHKLTNPTAKSVKTLMKLDAEYKIALTGTIITNVPENAFIPLKWIGATNANFSQFKGCYNVYGGFGGYQCIAHKNLDVLQELIANFALRKTKEQVLDLPPKNLNIEYVDMYDDQEKLYRDVEKGIAEELDKLDPKPTILQELSICIRLRQITENPSMLSTEITGSGKLDRLYDLVDQIVSSGEKVVVFGNFKETCYRIHDELAKYNPVVCTGDQSDFEIDGNMKQFTTDPKCSVMVATWQKMGTGFNMTVASHMIFISTPWTAASAQQAQDRIFRIGQSKPVFITTLIARGTYDERVQEILDGKAELGSYLVKE